MHKAKRFAVVAAALLTASAWTSSASAKPVPAPPPACSAVTFSVTTLSCRGFYRSNLVAKFGPKLTSALSLTSTLGGGATGLLEKIDWKSNQVASLIDFTESISGKTVIGIHFGGGNGGYNGTAFWLLDAPAGTDTITWYSDTQKGHFQRWALSHAAPSCCSRAGDLGVVAVGLRCGRRHPARSAPAPAGR